jgi:hypothetical protein
MNTATTLGALDKLRHAVESAPFRNLSGRFHAHLTVAVAPESVEGLRAFCKTQRVKLTVVDLDDLAGRSQTDVMTTSYYDDPAEGAVGRIVEHLSGLAEALGGAGFNVVRAKLEHESLPSLPQYDRQRYHEVHVKLKVAADQYDATVARLRELGKAHGFVPSRNPRERSADWVTQFVNLRLYEGRQESADRTVAGLLAALREAGLEVVEVKRETTVFDTHQQLDQWWI